MNVAYLAGFFDGEGCIFMGSGYKGWNGKQYLGASLYLCVAQNVREPLELFQERWGGAIHLRKKGASYDWRMCGWAEVTKALREMRDFLTVKREQADLVLSYYDDQMRRYSTAFRAGFKLTPEQKEERIAVRDQLTAMHGRAKAMA